VTGGFSARRPCATTELRVLFEEVRTVRGGGA
jgi:hypothetical protein